MKTLRKRNLVPGNVFVVLAVALLSAPLIAGEREQANEQVIGTWGQGLQEKVANQLGQAVNEVALSVSIESNPVISLESESMMANVDESAGMEDDCDD